MLFINNDVDFSNFDNVHVSQVGIYTVIGFAGDDMLIRYVMHDNNIVHQNDYIHPDYCMSDEEVVLEYLSK